MANWESKTVRDVITKIVDDEIVLPVIQRRLVWDEEQMLKLFDSLFVQNSFGSIMCVEEQSGEEPLFSCRPFTKDGSMTNSTNPPQVTRTRMFVIDGQQRLQSFYIGLWGTFKGKSLFYDLFSNYRENEYNFDFGVSADKLPPENKDSSVINEHFWYQASLLFNRLTREPHRSVADDIINRAGITDYKKIDHIKENVRNFFDRIFADTSIGISKVSAHLFSDTIKDRERIAELFQRLNSGGTTLTNYDLIYSSLSALDDDMESFFETLESGYSEIGINRRTIIRLMYVLTDHPIKNEDSMKEEAGFIAEHKERIEKTLEALKKFLIASDHVEWFKISGKSVIPLYFLAYHIFYNPCDDEKLPNLFDNYDTNNPDFCAMQSWLKVSLLNRAFSYNCGWRAYSTGMTQIHKVMKGSQGKRFPISNLFTLYRERLNKFARNRITVNTLAFFDEDYMFYLTYGMPKSSVREEDIDHIHPRSRLKKAGIDESKINSFGNLQLLDIKDNRNGKRAKEFGDWIKIGVLDETRPQYLKKHLIPEDTSLWYSDRFDDFLSARLQLIVDKIKSEL